VTGPAPTAGETASLVAALRVQDPLAATALRRRYAPLVFRILGRTLGPGTRIGETVHVVLLCVLDRGPRLRLQSDLRRVVLAATARVAQVELRRRPPVGNLGAGARQDQVLRFYRILDRMAAADRIAFVLHRIEGLDSREVAAVMGASSARTNVRLRRGLRQVFDGIVGDPVLSRLRTG